MKKLASILLLLFAAAVITGCSKLQRSEHIISKIDAGCETVGDLSDKPMEGISDDDQGVIYF
ncbi:MAG: hypothetical protein K5652_01275 [Bacteroidales bacterium]|nr:hypothetical protein [Bacteroidales bacterium]